MSDPTASASLWNETHVACPLVARERLAVVRELAACLRDVPGLLDPGELLRGLEAREEESSTFLGRGLALPHARTAAVDRIVMAAGTCPEGVPWGPEGELANLVFLVGVPRAAVRSYLDLASKLTKAARRPDWVERMAACRDATALAAALRGALGG